MSVLLVIMVAVCNRADHYIFILFLLLSSSFFLLFFHRLISAVGHIFATKACIDNRKKLVKQQYLLYMF